MYEWISRLKERKNCFNGDEPKHWTPKLIQQLKNIDNKILRAIDFRVDIILGGFIFEFAVDLMMSYSKSERKFFNGPRGKYLRSLKFSINMILCEKGILRMQSN